jgi:hypothetical protein
MQVAGYLGHFGPKAYDQEYNEKVEEANKLVDEYNRNVADVDGNEQMKYQAQMKKRMYEVLGIIK